jgi:hypothetical protein
MSDRICGNCGAPLVDNDRGGLIIWASSPRGLTSCHLCSSCNERYENNGMAPVSNAWRQGGAQAHAAQIERDNAPLVRPIGRQ